MKSRCNRSPSVSSIASDKSDGYSSQSGASMTSTQDSRRSNATDATGYNSDNDGGSYHQIGSTSKMSVASLAKTTTGLTQLVQSSIAKLKRKGGCPVKIIKQDLKDSHGYTLTSTHNTRRLNIVLKNLQKDGKIVKTAKGYKLVTASKLRRRRRHHRHKGRRRRRRRRRRGRGRRRRKFRRARGRKHRRRRRRRQRRRLRHGRQKGRKGHGRRRRRRRRRHGRKHATGPGGSSKVTKLQRGVAKLSLKGNLRPLPGGPVPQGSSPPSMNTSRLPSRLASRIQSRTASRLPSRAASQNASRNPSPTCKRVRKRAKVLESVALVDDDSDE